MVSIPTRRDAFRLRLTPLMNPAPTFARMERTTLSVMRNRAGVIVGMTCRVGRAIEGGADMIRDLLVSGRSVLLLGRPGVGKTTAIRESRARALRRVLSHTGSHTTALAW